MAGFGLGLRPWFYEQAARGDVPVDWMEAITENFMVPGGRPVATLLAVRENYPVSLHGVSADLGGTDPLDDGYLDELVKLVGMVQPERVSDHLCWSRVDGEHLHDLLPLPATGEVVRHVADRISRVQDRLGRRIAIENPTTYLRFESDEMTEIGLLRDIAVRADCDVLLDVTNLAISAHNHGLDPLSLLAEVPFERVTQVHLAGHDVSGSLWIDSHDAPVPASVWKLYEAATTHCVDADVMVERDDEGAPLTAILADVEIARRLHHSARQQAT